MMPKIKRCTLLVLLLLPALVHCEEKKSATDSRGCAFIMRSCQSQCRIKSNDYVQWRVDGGSNPTKVSCERRSPTDGVSKTDKTETSLLVALFDVPCCPSDDATPPQPPSSNSKLTIHCLDDAKLNTLFILGVTTLACILLMCLFMCLGLLLFRTRNRSYKLDGLKEENQSLTKGSEKTSTTLTFSDCGHDNSTPTSSSTPPPKYKALKATNSKTVNLNSNPTIIERKHAVQEQREPEEGEYVNQESLRFGGPRSLIIRKDDFDVISDGNGSTKTGKVIASKGRIPDDYEIRGGFIRPKRTSTRSEEKTTRFAETDEAKADVNQVAGNLMEQETTSVHSSRHSNISDQQIENPYVEAPPLKSLRSTTKFETPSAYQTLLMEGSNDSNETNEYNTLIHSVTVVPNNDKKSLLVINNNSATRQIGQPVNTTPC